MAIVPIRNLGGGSGEVKSVPLVAPMTSANTPSGYVVTESGHVNNFYSYQAFDQNPETVWYVSKGAQWVQIELPQAKKAKYCKVKNGYNATEQVHSVNVSASNDGTNFVVIGSYVNTNTETAVEWGFDLLPTTSYKYYRFNIVDNNGSNLYSNLNEIQFYTAKP